MKKISYDKNGNICPYEIIQLSHDECVINFIEDFNNEPKRKENWGNLIQYNKDLKQLINSILIQWIDGSYTTKKQKPNDIDVVSFIDSINFKEQLKAFDMNLSLGYPKFKYNIDGYIVIKFPKGTVYFDKITLDRYNYWKKWFGTDREGNPKAIIEIKND
ncbi:DUF6932 family protein [Aliarcobacter butzleri]|uniref:Uncharacterized protein n=1 Tax=Aliarcobacter butzleri TaxID=28197 RepID=A0AAW6VIE4_9BACT|nr:hypothetical protein [Aliarcobacter butzleri]MDK2042086.1 hypothetical protein [Aliarcobacter butzleri]MDK2097305.1 hypothetical protein [Aliarcobacter butzleri]